MKISRGPASKTDPLKSLREIPGIGKSIAVNLRDIGIRDVKDLIGRDPQDLYDMSNRQAGCIQDRCLLYVFRCAVYYANTPEEEREKPLLQWWNWK